MSKRNQNDWFCKECGKLQSNGDMYFSGLCEKCEQERVTDILKKKVVKEMEKLKFTDTASEFYIDKYYDTFQICQDQGFPAKKIAEEINEQFEQNI